MGVDSPDDPPLWDRYTRTRGRVHLTGLQAIVRVLLDQVRIDRACGRRTGAVASGYPGSPLSGLDRAFLSVEPLLRENDVKLLPALNEELAASAIGGTQTFELFPHSRFDGVIGMWFGKAPGLDRAMDAIRHSNFLGTSRFGGALAVVGDDPFCKSSSLPSHSEHAFAHSLVPVFQPADAEELLELGLLGVALSRYAGLWVGMKVVADVADGGVVLELPQRSRAIELPKLTLRGRPFTPALDPRLLPPHVQRIEEAIIYDRLEAARRFAFANEIDRIEVRHARDRLGLVASGRLYRELQSALDRLGLGERELEELGIRLMRLRMVWPVEPRRLREFADDLDELVVIDERRGFIEEQVRASLCNQPDHPFVVGQHTETGEPWLARHPEVNGDTLAIDLGRHLARRLDRPDLAERAAGLEESRELATPASDLSRTPHFCSGCPHSTSTRLPEGSVAAGGIGCHTMALLMDRGVQYVGAMGSEGMHWAGVSPFVDTGHVFQNLGDGTYFHSARLAVRACVEAGADITFKLLYNGSIAMTGGQQAVGEKSIEALVRDLLSDGVRKVIAMSGDASLRRLASDSANVECIGRSGWIDAMTRIREERGVTFLIYDQLCANEQQRLERRGVIAAPSERILINEDVCEGCGDCGARSACASLEPVATPLGRKTRIHESSCTDDRACVDGDCPAFVSVSAPPPKPPADETWMPQSLPEPPPPEWTGDRYNAYLVGVGSTGVVTADAILVRAAEIDGLFALHLDQTGLAQRGGKVTSHCIFGRRPVEGGARIGLGEADALLAFDPLCASDAVALRVLDPDRTRAVIHDRLSPTEQMITRFDVELPDVDVLVDRIGSRVHSSWIVQAELVAEAALGEARAANVVLLGYALQSGLLPLSANAVEQSIRDCGPAVETNLKALSLGRVLAIDPSAAERILADTRPPAVGEQVDPTEVSKRLGMAWDRFDELLSRFVPSDRLEALRRHAAAFAADLIDYQDRDWAERYLQALTPLARAEAVQTPHSVTLTETAVRELYRLMAYKDEYEVARLLLQGPWRRWLERRSTRPRGLRYHLRPPLLRALGVREKIRLGVRCQPLLRTLVRLRRIRGTWLDPFGYTELRRAERELVVWYRDLLARLARSYSATTAEACVEIAALAGSIRGYEDLKLARADRARTSAAAKLGELEKPSED